MSARVDRGRAGGRQEPAVRGAARLPGGAAGSRPLATGTLPALRRGDRVLGVGGDREGGVRHPRIGHARAGGCEARARRFRRTIRIGPGCWRGLAPLVGAPAEPAAQEESFAAWRRFCEGLAAERTTVLVFEDLHWADPALLAFLEHLADWAEGVPLLLLCTARPELYERHPTFGAERSQRTADQPRSAERRGDRTARLGAARAGGAAGRDAAGAAGAGGRQPVVRRGVRAPARRPRRRDTSRCRNRCRR